MDETSSVKDFYSQFPYPSKKIDSVKNLFKNSAWITNLLGFNPNDFPKDSLILEAGCGTGEFSCGFGLSRSSKVIGVDISLISLKKAKETAKKFRLKNVKFVEANVLNLPFKSNYFDFVFSLGCIHHTKNPKKAFKEIVRVLKPNGFVVLGVYNKYGRFFTRVKKLFLNFLFFVFKINSFEDKIRLINKLFYSGKKLSEKRRIWIADKYLHPNEFFHSISEVLNWFKENNIEYSNASIPRINLINSNPYSFLNKLNFFLTQLGWLFREKSFFILVGKKLF